MAQPVSRGRKSSAKRQAGPRRGGRRKKEYGTSKLEEKFARDFLDRLGVKYVYQFKAESIKRFYDFYLPEANLIIEVDGDYYHSYNILYEDMSPMQKKNHRVDRQKDEWALAHGIPIIRIWEHDILKNQSGVMDMLKEKIGKYRDQYEKEKDKKKRH